jgi:hypothetical protein
MSVRDERESRRSANSLMIYANHIGGARQTVGLVSELLVENFRHSSRGVDLMSL